MKAYGQTKRIKANFPDHHPQNGYMNWWEDEMVFVCKKSERKKSKKKIKEELTAGNSQTCFESSIE